MARMMKAALYFGAGDIRIDQVPIPVRRPGEVLVKITRSGMCGTDAGEWKSGPRVFPVKNQHLPYERRGSFILGHEFIGEVAESDDSRFPVGSRVACGAGVSCGQCDRCEEGRTNLCIRYQTYGLNLSGGMAEYAAVDARTLVKIPGDLSDDAAGLAQPLAVGLHAARRARVKSADRVFLIGAGAIGTFALLGLKHLFDADVTVTDFAGSRLERARRLGARSIIAADDSGAEKELAELRRTFDLTIEASGASGQLNRAIEMTRDGGTVLQVGIPMNHELVDIHQLVFREINIRTTLAHVCHEDLPEALEILKTPTIADQLLDSVHPLEDLPEQLNRLTSGHLEGKVLFDPTRQ